LSRKNILFICQHNSARSQIAEGYLNARYGQEYVGRSAGMEPTGVNPYAIKVMSEIGIDISHHRSKGISEFSSQEFDLAVTVCDQAREACPFFPGARSVEHQGFDDPSSSQPPDAIDVFRRSRDEITQWIDERFGNTPSGD